MIDSTPSSPSPLPDRPCIFVVLTPHWSSSLSRFIWVSHTFYIYEDEEQNRLDANACHTRNPGSIIIRVPPS